MENKNQYLDQIVFIDYLPNEILIFIISLLDCDSIYNVSRVCKRWYNLSLSPVIWNNIKVIINSKNYTNMRTNIIPLAGEKIKKVKLQCFKLYSEIRSALTTYCLNLIHLEIIISQVDSCIFQDLEKWHRLRYLSFRNSLISQDKAAVNSNYVFEVPFHKLSCLETLVLSNFALTTQSLNNMLLCQNLNNINIEKMKNIPSSFLYELILCKKRTLKSLYVYGDTLNEIIMTHIGQCSMIDVLHIMTCKNLFDSSLFHLRLLTHLKSLKLRHGYFSSGALFLFFSTTKFNSLTYLSLSRCLHVTIEIAQAIKSSAPNLKELSFYLCPFILGNTNCDRFVLEKIFNIQLLLD